MLRKKMNELTLILLMTPVVFLQSACSKSTEPARTNEPAPRTEQPVAPISQLLPASPTPTATPVQKSAVPPSANEIRDAVSRVFNKVASADIATEPNFAVGDFNGDGSEDLAVAVTASEGSLGEINNELANWVLEDPRMVPLPNDPRRMGPPKPVKARKGDALLAIIHGVGAQGWRAPEAKQTFVLKNTAGSRVLAQSPKSLRGTTQKLPPLMGDVLNETISGKSGFLFWTGAKYAWWTSINN